MTTLMVILLLAAMSFALAKALHLPSIPMLLLSGIALRAVASEFDLSYRHDTVLDMLQLGLAFLLFAAGMELNPNRIGVQKWAAIRIGILQFAASAVLGAAIGTAMGWRGLPVMYIGLAIAASSTIVVVRILMERRQFFEPFGRLVLGVLLVQDILMILLISILGGVDRGMTGVLSTTAAIVAMVGLSFVFIRWISPWLIIRQRLDQESMLLSSVAILFLFVGTAHFVGLPLPVGAFLAGVALSAFPVSGIIRAPINSLSTFFLALFFVALGSSLGLPGWREVVLALLLSAAVILLTPPLVAFLAERAGLSTRASLESGLLLAQCSELSIVIVVLGLELGHVDREVASVIAMTTVITMIMTSLIATDRTTLWLVRIHPAHRTMPVLPELNDHILMLGCGSNSRILLDLLMLEGHRVVIVDDDPGVVDTLRRRGLDVFRGDGSDTDLLNAVRAKQSRVVVSTMRRLQDNLRLLRYMRNSGVPVVVRVFDDADTDLISGLGGRAVCEAHAAADDLIRWFRVRSRKQPATGAAESVSGGTA